MKHALRQGLSVKAKAHAERQAKAGLNALEIAAFWKCNPQWVLDNVKGAKLPVVPDPFEEEVEEKPKPKPRKKKTAPAGGKKDG